MSGMRCGYCAGVSFIYIEDFKNHMVENHPESEIAKRQSKGLDVSGLFGPDFAPVVMVVNGEDPVVSMMAADAMHLGYKMLMTGRQMYDDWCLIRVFESHQIPEEQALEMMRELRVLRTGQSTESTDPPPGS